MNKVWVWSQLFNLEDEQGLSDSVSSIMKSPTAFLFPLPECPGKELVPDKDWP